MIANYGYKDGSGEYFISIDTDKCIDCAAGRACLAACPVGMFETMVDDYDDEVVQVKAQFRRSLPYDCAGCKPAGGWTSLRCVSACAPGAIAHSW
ncbi:MAG TPA: 4Fe-4S dicluster domain-containing protein [Alphaproteobacteria bacterium]|nr:4Fe-4S dicluster domain-containing protein [Alphaproteobacteria bacterium]